MCCITVGVFFVVVVTEVERRSELRDWCVEPPNTGNKKDQGPSRAMCDGRKTQYFESCIYSNVGHEIVRRIASAIDSFWLAMNGCP